MLVSGRRHFSLARLHSVPEFVERDAAVERNAVDDVAVVHFQNRPCQSTITASLSAYTDRIGTGRNGSDEEANRAPKGARTSSMKCCLLS